MRRDLRPAFAVLLALAIPPGVRAGGSVTRPEESVRTIELHVGVPGLAYIGQPLQDFRKRFPKAEVAPFSGQEDAVSVKAGDDGLSCIEIGRASCRERV